MLVKHPCIRCDELMEVRNSDLSRNKGVCVCKVCRPKRKLELAHKRREGIPRQKPGRKAGGHGMSNQRRKMRKQTAEELAAINKAIDDAQAAENLRIDKLAHVRFSCKIYHPGDPEFDAIAAQCKPLNRIRRGVTRIHNYDLITANEVCGRRNRFPENWGAEV